MNTTPSNTSYRNTTTDSIYNSLQPSSLDFEKKVSFKTVHIREYERVVGDNPAVPAGPPLSIGWRYNPKSRILSVDEHEDESNHRRESQKQQGKVTSSQHPPCKRLSATERDDLLRKEFECSRRSVQQAVEQTNIDRARRRKSKQGTLDVGDAAQMALKRAKQKVKKHVSKAIMKLPTSRTKGKETKINKKVCAAA